MAAAGLTGGRVNKFNITKQSKVGQQKPVAHCVADPIQAPHMSRSSNTVPKGRGPAGCPIAVQGIIRCCACCAPLACEQDYDPQGDYIRLWVPELAKVPASRIHEPWLMSKQVNGAIHFFLYSICRVAVA